MSKYENLSKEELITLLQKQEEELKRKKYGLVWEKEREPEKVVLECAKHLPILKVVDEKTLKTDASDDNILIEGDNYHALSVLCYTHKEKIDVIYIDPPYNTGQDDFKYNDKYVDKEDKYRHSKWLNFMEKRLLLAKELLTDTGVIFISIDDNEMSQLKLLCDRVFGEENFIGLSPRIVKKGGKSAGNYSKNHDYLLMYFKSSKGELLNLEHTDKGFKYKDEFEEERGLYKLNQTLDYDSIQYSKSLDYAIEYEDGYIRPGGSSEEMMIARQCENPDRDWCWRWSPKLYDFGLANGFIVIKKYKDKLPRIYTKTYQNAVISQDDNGEYFVEILPRKKPMASIEFLDNIYSNDNAKKELRKVFGQGKVAFDYPKPTELIKQLLRYSSKENSIILDFFAGSGTTGQAVYELNQEDSKNRKFILCTNNENNICENITYKRLKKTSMNLRYFKTALLPKSKSPKQLKAQLTQECIEMLCVKETIFNLQSKTKSYKIFTCNAKVRFLCVYFSTSRSDFKEFLEALKSLDGEKKVYVFSDRGSVDGSLFRGIKNCHIEEIPQKILDVYKRLVKLNVSSDPETIFIDFEKARKRVFDEKDKEDGARLLRVVLEKVIEKIAAQSGVNVNDFGELSRLNDHLKQKEMISKIVWEENKTYIAIGNSAAHGDYDEYEMKDVENFYRHIQSLIEKYIG